MMGSQATKGIDKVKIVKMRATYLKHTLESVERIITLIDRNPFSPTYGCIDRSYWQYKTIDYSAGTSQLGSLLLALVYKTNFPGNIYYRNERIKELAIAGINFLRKNAHSDGTSDDYYPFERALGATSFSLYGCSEAYIVLEHKDKEIERFFRKVADWMLNNNEPGKISNHQFVAAVALTNVYKITGDNKYLDEAKKRVNTGLSWMSDEGWFYEYEGCDPGYLTFSIDFLAKYYKKTQDKKIIPVVKKAVEFASYFIHPDGSYGGVYGSRNTTHFLPHGLEVFGKEIPLATQITDLFLEGMRNGMEERMNDDRYFIFDYDFIQAYIDFNEARKGKIERHEFEKYFPEAKILIKKHGFYYIVVSMAKGGVCSIFRGSQNVYNDAGLIGTTKKGDMIVTQMMDEQNKIEMSNNMAKVEGPFNKAGTMLQSQFKFLLFRGFSFTIGRSNFFSHIMKKYLTKFLILKKKRVPVKFERTFEFGSRIKITDIITIKGDVEIKRLAIGPDHTSIYIPTSRYYQKNLSLGKWIYLDSYLEELNRNKTVKIQRLV